MENNFLQDFNRFLPHTLEDILNLQYISFELQFLFHHILKQRVHLLTFYYCCYCVLLVLVRLTLVIIFRQFFLLSAANLLLFCATSHKMLVRCCLPDIAQATQYHLLLLSVVLVICVLMIFICYAQYILHMACQLSKLFNIQIKQ